MPFVCMVSAEHLMMVLRGLEGLSNVVVITVKENEGMFGHAQDEALVALCDWKISYDAFPHFEFFRTHKTMYFLELERFHSCSFILNFLDLDIYAFDNRNRIPGYQQDIMEAGRADAAEDDSGR